MEAVNSERSVVATEVTNTAYHANAEAEAGWVIADMWSETEMDRLSMLLTMLWHKKADELKLKKVMKMDVRGEELDWDIDDKRVNQFRKSWIAEWSSKWGSLEDVTMINSMPFTCHRPPPCAYPCDTLQIYSAKVAGLSGDLKWPLDVFGMVAVRDPIDHNLNIVFYRTRDSCQTLTEKDPFLALTGPTRAVLVTDPLLGPVTIEAELTVKGNTESEDQYLSFLAAPLVYSSGSGPCMFDSHYWGYTSKNSTLKVTVAKIASSVEATIFIQVIEGSWPEGVHGQITAHLFDIEPEKIVLLEFGDDNNVHVSGDGDVELSRRVVSVAVNEGLVISYYVCRDGRMVAEQLVVFKAALAGRNFDILQLGTCKLEVLVAWSVVSPEPDGTAAWC